MSTIDQIMAVPSGIAFRIREWSNADPGHDEWPAIGTAIDSHVAEQVANALRIERGGCTACPAAKGEAHNFGCKAPRVKRSSVFL